MKPMAFLGAQPRRFLGAVASAVAAVLAACTSTPVSRETAPAPAPAGRPATGDAPAAAAAARVSGAASPRDYRRDAASHLYGLNRSRIYTGRLPPMLYAVGVLEVDLDGGGHVRRLHWLRAPSHAPEVVAEIERTVRAAAPFPVPTRLGRVTYTDTWLWHRSGRFQLDTLTEGQD